MKTKSRLLILPTVLLIAATSAFFTQNAQADQQHMQAALAALQNARYELSQAERDKGGHRTKAAELTDRAIEQVRAGIAVGQ